MMRAQVSLFAIIGVLIVLVGVGVFAALQITSPASVSGFEDVELAFSECVEAEVRDLIPLAAQHGGELAYAIPSSQPVPRSLRDPQGGLVPVWTSFSSGSLSYTRPKLDDRDSLGGGTRLSVEEQFELALDSTLESCLVDSARSLGVDAQVSRISSDVVIADEFRVSALAIGSFARDDRSASRLSAQVRVPSSFLSLFDAASELSSLEARTGVFAAYVEDIIVLGSGLDARYPPMYEYDFSYATRVWSADAVAAHLESDLDATLGLIQFTSSDTPLDPPYLVRRGLIDFEDDSGLLGDEVFLSVRRAGPVQVSFDGGRIVSGEPLISMIPIVGDLIPIREYRTRYDVSVPMMATLTSRDDGLRFRFALEPRIENNQVLREGAGSLASDAGDLAVARRAFCSDPTGARVSVSVSGPVDPDQTTLVYRCGGISCSYPFDSSITLPACIGGTLSAQASNVRFSEVPVDSRTAFGSASLDARARVLAPVSGRIVETRLERSGGRPHALEPRSSRSITPGERLIVTFEGLDVDHVASAILTDSDVFETLLYEGVYSVSVVAIRDLASPVVIPERADCALGLGSWCLAGAYTVDRVDLVDALLLAQFSDLGPLFVSGDPISLEVPIFDIERIPQADRVVEDLEFYDVLSRSRAGLEVVS